MSDICHYCGDILDGDGTTFVVRVPDGRFVQSHEKCAPLYPEHEKLKHVSDKAQTIGLFLRWMLNERKWLLCYEDSHGDPQRVEDSRGVDALLADLITDHLGIDRQKLHAEKRAMAAADKAQHLRDTRP